MAPLISSFHPFSDLPYELLQGHLTLFRGLPTFIGGFDETRNKTSNELFQYHWSTDEWILMPDVTLEVSRYAAAVFQVPIDLYGIC
jgi:hypothetical protein